MMKPPFYLLLCLLPFAGCGTATDLSSKLVGDWQGRPEMAVERLLREWPTEEKPSEEEAATQATKTDLEIIEPLKITMRLDQDGKAKLSLDDADSDDEGSLSGKWFYRATNPTQGMLEIVIERDNRADDSSRSNLTEVADNKPTKSERRRFLVELVIDDAIENDQFLLVEEGADPRFGRLLFERKSS